MGLSDRIGGGVAVAPPWLEGARIEQRRPMDVAGMRDAMAQFLAAAGFDAADEAHLRQTAERVAEAWSEDLLGGYRKTPEQCLGAPFPAEAPDLVVVRDIEFFSSCPHHLLPYRGVAHVAYLPTDKAVGFSGIIRMLDALAHRLTLQEWLTRDVVACLNRALAPRGAACLIEATPMCVFARGVKRPCEIQSSAFAGCFDEDPDQRSALLRILTQRRTGQA